MAATANGATANGAKVSGAKVSGAKPRKSAGAAGAGADPGRAERVRRAAELIRHAGDATRLSVILNLAEGERHVGALCELDGQAQPAMSHHLSILRHSGVVRATRQGKQNVYSLTERGEALAGAVGGLVG